MSQSFNQWCISNAEFILDNFKNLKDFKQEVKNVGIIDEEIFKRLKNEGCFGTMIFLSLKTTNQRNIKNYLQPLRLTGNSEIANKLETDFAQVLSQPMSWQAAEMGFRSGNEMDVDLSQELSSGTKIEAASPRELGINSEKKIIHGKDYRFLKCIGFGGFGVVYKAKKIETGDQFAIKIMAHQRTAKHNEMLQREISILKEATKTNGSYIVNYINHEEVNDSRDILHLKPEIIPDHLYNGPCTRLVMELMDCSLRDWMRKMTGSNDYLHAAEKIILQAMTGLEHLHSQSIIHRDLKVDNILLKIDAQGGFTAKLGDLGLARLASDSTQTLWVGTMWYMSPEQKLLEDYGIKADVYSMGKVIQEVIYNTELGEEIEDLEAKYKLLDTNMKNAEFVIKHPFWGLLYSAMTMHIPKERITTADAVRAINVYLGEKGPTSSETRFFIPNAFTSRPEFVTRAICNYKVLSEIKIGGDYGTTMISPLALLCLIAMHKSTLKVIDLVKVTFYGGPTVFPKIFTPHLKRFKLDVKFDSDNDTNNGDIITSLFLFTKEVQGGERKTFLEDPEMDLDCLSIRYKDSWVFYNDERTLFLSSRWFKNSQIILKEFKGENLHAMPRSSLPTVPLQITRLVLEHPDTFPDRFNLNKISQLSCLKVLYISFSQMDRPVVTLYKKNPFSKTLKVLGLMNVYFHVVRGVVMEKLETLILIKTSVFDREGGALFYDPTVLKKLVVTSAKTQTPEIRKETLQKFVTGPQFKELFIEFNRINDRATIQEGLDGIEKFHFKGTIQQEGLKGRGKYNISEGCSNILVSPMPNGETGVFVEESVGWYVEAESKLFHFSPFPVLKKPQTNFLPDLNVKYINKN